MKLSLVIRESTLECLEKSLLDIRTPSGIVISSLTICTLVLEILVPGNNGSALPKCVARSLTSRTCRSDGLWTAEFGMTSSAADLADLLRLAGDTVPVSAVWSLA